MNFDPVQVITLAGKVLAQAEAFVAGQPVTINVPDETFDVDGIKIIGSAAITLRKG